MAQKFLARLIRGEFTPKELRSYVITTTLIFISLITLSLIQCLRSGPYSPMTNMVSHLGTWTINPNGYWYFIVGFTFWGVFNFPIIFYIHRRISVPRSKWFALFGTIFMVISAIGIVGIALFPDVREPSPFGIDWMSIHHVFAYLAIIFFMAGLFCYYEVIFEDFGAALLKKKHYFNFKHYAIPAMIFLFVFVGSITSQLLAIKIFDTQPYPGIYSRTLWEWILFIMALIEVNSLALLLPKEVPVHIDYKKEIHRIIQKIKDKR